MGIDRIRAWLRSRSTPDTNAGGGEEDIALSVSEIAVDIDGIQDAVTALGNSIAAAMSVEFSADSFESLLIALDIGIAHLNSHWARLRTLLDDPDAPGE